MTDQTGEGGKNKKEREQMKDHERGADKRAHETAGRKKGAKPNLSLANMTQKGFEGNSNMMMAQKNKEQKDPHI